MTGRLGYNEAQLCLTGSQPPGLPLTSAPHHRGRVGGWCGLKFWCPHPGLEGWGEPLRCSEPKLAVKGKGALLSAQAPLTRLQGVMPIALRVGQRPPWSPGCFETLGVAASAITPLEPPQSGWTEQSMGISCLALERGHLDFCPGPSFLALCPGASYLTVSQFIFNETGTCHLF